jgi:peroxiredoxin
MVAVCADSPEELRKGKGKHGLEAVMLSDKALIATDALGLRNIGAMIAPRAVPVPVPISILVDAQGIVRWVDQSKHYTDHSLTVSTRLGGDVPPAMEMYPAAKSGT